MANGAIYYDELRFDTRDPAFTHVYCFIRGEGDCPFNIHGWHHKAFPKEVTTEEIFGKIWSGHTDPSTWEREAPQAVETPPIYAPHDRVPVPVEQLQNWHQAFAMAGDPPAVEMAEQITSHLTSVTQWDKVCPYCRAHDMMLQAQRNPPQ
jgi:hypothetical protein